VVAEVSPKDHARRRAAELEDDVRSLITVSRYPVVNPNALIIEHHVTYRYDRVAMTKVPVEGAPRAWLTDTLRVAGVADARSRRFLFTGAQNDAPVHRPFWRNLQAYAAAIGAEIIVGAWTYETSWWDESNPLARAYDPLLTEHLCFGQMEIGDSFVFCGEMNTLPTAARPISDLGSYSRGRWAVFPHAKIQLRSIPSTDPGMPAHQVMTSGAVTIPKVIPRKAGVKSIFHHVIGATLVEFDEEGDIFARQIIADEAGTFYDLDAEVRDGEVTRGHRARAVTIGDIHRAKISTQNARGVFGFEPATGRRVPGSLLDTLQPDYIFLHDLHDNESRNHHHKDDVSHDFEMAIRGRESVREEIQKSVDFLLALDLPMTRIVVVESNHDLALERYIREGRYRMDGINYRFGLQLDDAYHAHRERVAAALDAEVSPPSFSLLEWSMRHLAGSSLDHVRWVHDGRSMVIDGVELGHHGFRGANGAHGSVAGFAQLGRKMSIGDKHSPEILDGVYVAGVMQLQMGYNKGPSGWNVTHIVQYQNGKRSLVTMTRGKWRSSSL